MAVGDHERRRHAWRRLRDQRRRAGELRVRVIAISLIAFVLLWGVVFAQMATGNDPVLGNGKKAVSSTPKGKGESGGESAEAAAAGGESEAGYEEPAYEEAEYEEPAYEERAYEEPAYEEEYVEPEYEEPAPVVTSQS